METDPQGLQDHAYRVQGYKCFLKGGAHGKENRNLRTERFSNQN